MLGYLGMIPLYIHHDNYPEYCITQSILRVEPFSNQSGFSQRLRHVLGGTEQIESIKLLI